MILCYLDTSSKNISIERQQEIVSAYAAKHENIEIFFKDNDISALINALTAQKNTILLANVVCLGKSTQKRLWRIKKPTDKYSDGLPVTKNAF